SRFFVREREGDDEAAGEGTGDDWHPLSEEEMEAELDRAEAEEAAGDDHDTPSDDQPPRRDD
ncbi:MAG: hypothetical protein ACLFQD_08180, partial [Thiohalospira sp.]